MIFGPDGNLYISSRGNDDVLRFDGATGAFIGVFVAPSAGGLIDPYGLAFGPNGNLFITTADHRVLEFNGSTGAFVRILVTAASGGLNQPHGLLFKPDGKLLVASYGSNAVLEYNGITGAFIRRFDSGGPTTGMWGLQRPWTLRLSRRGDVVFVTSNLGSTALHSYDVVSGWFLRSYYILAMDMAGPTGFDVMPPAAGDCNMNLVPDACDIASGHSHDLNGNGVPDECDPHVPGDITGDGHVNVDDLLAVITSWGRCPAPPAPCPADIAPPLSGDGAVNVDDLLFVITHWG
jgi:WD40 repeat protein